MCIGTEYEKVMQNVADYEFKLKISECMRANFEFLILTLNSEFRI